jgi:dTMP kinase
MSFVVLEGIDGAGKTTVLQHLSPLFSHSLSFPAHKVKEIDEFLKSHIDIPSKALDLLFLSEMVWLTPEQGSVISARYVHSTAAYSKQLSFDDILVLVKTLKLREPDVVIWLDVDVGVALERLNRDRDRYENERLLERVREKYLKLYSLNFFAKRWVRIDANKPIKEVIEDVKAVLGG